MPLSCPCRCRLGEGCWLSWISAPFDSSIMNQFGEIEAKCGSLAEELRPHEKRRVPSSRVADAIMILRLRGWRRAMGKSSILNCHRSILRAGERVPSADGEVVKPSVGVFG
jgi:hypothetical protein